MRTNYVRGASLNCSDFQNEIRDMLGETGARGFRCGSEHGRAAVAFSSGGHRFRMVVPLPGQGDAPSPNGRPQPHIASEEAARRCWRQLSLLIRAKLDAVASGIVTFDEEFLAYMVMPGGSTVFKAVSPGIATAYAAAENSAKAAQ